MTSALDTNLTGRLTLGAAWTLGMRWSVRALGFISTLILARLLTPEDFGIVAMATVVAGLANVLFEFGVATVLIQKPAPKKQDYDTAWTLRFLQAALAGSVLVVVAPYAVAYFDEPRLEAVLWTVALATVIGGIENIGVVMFQKAMDFKRDFQFEVSRKIAQFLITLSLAFAFQSYWALVLGILFGRISGVVISYMIHAYRPRWDLSAAGEIWSFSRWILLLRIGAYARNEVDKLIIGGRGDTATVGYYFLASEIANIISQEILAPINRAVFPALSLLNQDPSSMKKAMHLALAAQATVTFPLTLGLALVASDLVPVFLGGQWIEIVPVVQILAWAGLPLSVRYTFSSALTAQRKLGVISIIVWAEIFLFISVVMVFLPDASILDMARIKVALSALVSITLLIYAVVLGLTSAYALANAFWRPVGAVAGMAVGLLALQPYLSGTHGIDLVAQVVAGATIYVILIMTFWVLAGRPDGFEAVIFKQLVPAS